MSVKVDEGAPKPALFLAATCEMPKRKVATEVQDMEGEGMN